MTDYPIDVPNLQLMKLQKRMRPTPAEQASAVVRAMNDELDARLRKEGMEHLSSTERMMSLAQLADNVDFQSAVRVRMGR